MQPTYKYQFDVLFTNGQMSRVIVYAGYRDFAYRNLYCLVNAASVTEARIALTTDPEA